MATSLEGATFTNARSAVSRVARRARGRLHHQRRDPVGLPALERRRAPVPDLFCYGLLADFRGYEPGYTKRLPAALNALTWVVLKARTNNTGGTSRCARAIRPSRRASTSATSRKAATRAARISRRRRRRRVRPADRRRAEGARRSTSPRSCRAGRSPTRRPSPTYVRNQAWGHHASWHLRDRPGRRAGVVTSNFKVHGVRGLRVVDASVFPRIPGLFIVSAVLMIGEKAADVIAADAGTPAAAADRAGPAPDLRRFTMPRALAIVSAVAAAAIVITGCHASAPPPHPVRAAGHRRRAPAQRLRADRRRARRR